MVKKYKRNIQLEDKEVNNSFVRWAPLITKLQLEPPKFFLGIEI